MRKAGHRRGTPPGRRALRPHPRPRAETHPRPMQVGCTPRRSRCDPDRPLPARARGEHPQVIPTGRDRCNRGLLSGYRPLLPSPARALRQPIAGPAAPRTGQEQPGRGHPLGARSRSRSYTERAPGAVAQLGERLAGSQKVRGSSPLGSIPFGSRQLICLWASLRQGPRNRDCYGRDVVKKSAPQESASPLVRSAVALNTSRSA